MESSIFLSAGDPSGDIASSLLIKELRLLVPNLKVFGLGGSRLKQLGQEQLADGKELAVLGFWEVARRFHFFQQLMNRIVAEIKARRPSAVILVDYPGFNLRLARRIKSLGIPIIYYITPQLWAWGKRRVREIRELVDQMIVILPFEKDFYRDQGVEVEFVGNYLLEDIPTEYVASPIPDSQPPTLALLPGSRKQEIERMLPTMLLAAVRFQATLGWSVTIAGVPDVVNFADYLCHAKLTDNIRVNIGDSRRTIFESNLVLTASGTATLETGIIGRPMVVMYKTSWLTYQIARRLVTLDKIALVNLVLGESVVPELIQHQATPAKLMAELTKYTVDDSYYDSVRQKLLNLPRRLGGTGASKRAAQLIAARLT